MRIAIYIFIFAAKIFENGLATLRLIVVANGKKWLGALLNGVIGLVWILTTGMIVTDVNKDVFKIVVFVIGSILGSYLGSFIEEKLALGSSMLTAIISKDKGDGIIKRLHNDGHSLTVSEGRGKEKSKYILMIMISRKKRRSLVELIKSMDKDSMIVAEAASTLYGGYQK